MLQFTKCPLTCVYRREIFSHGGVKALRKVRNTILEFLAFGLCFIEQLLYYYHDMTMKEIADTLGINVSSVSGRLKHAHAKLRNLLEKEDAYERE